MQSLYQKLRKIERTSLPDVAESRQAELLESEARQNNLLSQVITGDRDLVKNHLEYYIHQSLYPSSGADLKEEDRFDVKEKESELRELVGDTNPRNRIYRICYNLGAAAIIAIGLDYIINQIILKQPLHPDIRFGIMAGVIFAGKYRCGSLFDFANKLNKRANYIEGIIDRVYDTSDSDEAIQILN